MTQSTHTHALCAVQDYWTAHRRSQNFVWGVHFFAKKYTSKSSKNYPKNWPLLWLGCTSCPGGCTYTFSCKLGLKKISFTALGGAGAPTAPPGYAYGTATTRARSLRRSAAQSAASVWVSCGCGTPATRAGWNTCETSAACKHSHCTHAATSTAINTQKSLVPVTIILRKKVTVLPADFWNSRNHPESVPFSDCRIRARRTSTTIGVARIFSGGALFLPQKVDNLF